MNNEQNQNQEEQQHIQDCRQLEATPPPATFSAYRDWVSLWKRVYTEETRRARSYRSALNLFHRAGGSGRKKPLLAMTPEIEAAALRPTGCYDRPGRARLCGLRQEYKLLGARLWKAVRITENI